MRGLLICAALFCCMAVSAVAGVLPGTEWTAGVGNWHDINNWSNGIPDVAGEDPSVDNGGTAQIAQDVLYVGMATLGLSGSGYVVQNGGDVVIDNLFAGFNVGAVGDYTMSAGSLTTQSFYIGYDGEGTFNLDGGIFDGDFTYVGSESGTGTFNFNDGTLDTGLLLMGSGSLLNLGAPIDRFEVSEALIFEDGSSYLASVQVTINMSGSYFINEATDQSALSGLENTTFIFEGGPTEQDIFEVANMDYGAVEAGFDSNVVLAKLTIGGDDIGYVELIDGRDNGNSGGSGGWNEALYVDELVLNAGSTLDLAGFHLYTHSFVDNGGTVLNGDVIVMGAAVPEPCTLVMIAASAVGLVGVIRRKMR